MNKSTLLELTLFDPDNTLIALLEQRDIAFRKLPVTRKFVVAMDQTVKILSQADTEALIGNLALIFIEWLQQKRYRKVQVQLVDGSTLYIDEYDVDVVCSILKNSLKVSAFDPEYNNRILNK